MAGSAATNDFVMDLYCWRRAAVHTFELGDLEKIVYALTAWAWDFAATSEGRDVEYSPRELVCPKDMLSMAEDSEGYLEQVEQGVAERARLRAE